MQSIGMNAIRPIVIAALMVIPLLGCWAEDSSRAFIMVGEEREISGTVADAKLTLCSPTPDKPGTCEGTLVVEPRGKGEAERVTVHVTRNVQLKRDGQAVFLPQLRGSQVTIKYRATKEGLSVATSVSAAS